MEKRSIDKITVVSVKRPTDFSHRSRQNRKVRCEQSLSQEKVQYSQNNHSLYSSYPTTSIGNRNLSIKLVNESDNKIMKKRSGDLIDQSILANINVQAKKETKGFSIKQSLTNGQIDLGTIDDILIETKKKPKTKSSLFSNLNKMHCIFFIILLFILLACGSAILLILILYPATTRITSSSTLNTTTSSTSTSNTPTTTTSITTQTTTTTTSTSTSTAATITITSNVCTATWTGISLIYTCLNCSYYPVYYLYTHNYTAIATTTRIAFAFRGVNGYFGLDDVSVRNAASPNTEILINGGFEMGNLTGWGLCNQYNTSMLGGVKSNSSHFTYLGVQYYSRTGSYYYVGGTSNTTDYISQTFATIVGNLYLVTFAGMSGVNGSMAGADFFLGV